LPGLPRPSVGDEAYARLILEVKDELAYLVVLIVLTVPDTGQFRLLPFRALRGDPGVRMEEMALVIESPTQALETHAGLPRPQEVDIRPTFQRVEDAYDLDWLARCRVIIVGAGGSVGFVEDLARAGIGEFVLIDPDVVAEPNLATQ